MSENVQRNDEEEETGFGPAQYGLSKHFMPFLLYTSRIKPGIRYELCRSGSHKDVKYYECNECATLQQKDRLFPDRKIPRVSVRDDILLNDPDCPNGTEHFCEGRSLAKSEAVQLDRQIRNELRSGRTRLRPKNVYEEAKSLISERFAHYDEETRAEIERNFISYGSARRAYSRCAAMFASGEPIGYGKSKKLKLDTTSASAASAELDASHVSADADESNYSNSYQQNLNDQIDMSINSLSDQNQMEEPMQGFEQKYLDDEQNISKYNESYSTMQMDQSEGFEAFDDNSGYGPPFSVNDSSTEYYDVNHVEEPMTSTAAENADFERSGEWTSNANNLSLTQSQPLADTSIAQSNDKGKQAAGTLKLKLKYAPGSNNYKRYYPTKRRIGGLASSNSGTSSPLSPSYKLRLRPNASKIDASASGAQMILRSSSSSTGVHSTNMSTKMMNISLGNNIKRTTVGLIKSSKASSKNMSTQSFNVDEKPRRREQTLLIVKPDGVRRGLIGEIIRRFERRGYTLAAIKMATPSRQLIETHYIEHVGKPFFAHLVDFMYSGPICAMVWEGIDAVSQVQQMIGATDPLKSSAGTIRGDFSLDPDHNICDASANFECAEREISLWFQLHELIQLNSNEMRIN